MKWNKYRKIGKRAMALLLTASLLGGTLPAAMDAGAASQTDDSLRGATRHEDGSVTWDTVYFGNYWQSDTNGDGKADKKDQKEPIRWYVLSIENGEALLLSEKILVDGLDFTGEPNLRHIWNIPDSVPDNDPQLHPPADELMDVITQLNWGNCDIRSWLNGYGSDENMNGRDFTNDSFLADAFSASEQDAIQVSNLNMLSYREYDPDDPTNMDDKVFLLSRDELMMSDYGFSPHGAMYARKAWYTPYALEVGAELGGAQWEDPTAPGVWWTRTANEGIIGDADNVVGDGTMASNEMYPFTEQMGGRGVRPALRLNLSFSTQWRKGGTVTMTPEGELTKIKPASPEITIKPPASMEEAKNDVIAAMASFKMKNSTTVREVLAAARKSVAGGAEIGLAGDLERTSATSTKVGRAEIQFRITLPNGTSDTVTASWGIAPLNGFSKEKREEYFEKAKDVIYKINWDYPVSNNTTKEELLAAVKSAMPDEYCVTLYLAGFLVNKADAWKTGAVEGVFAILCSRYYDDYSYGKTVPCTETMTDDERLVTEDIDAVRAALDAMKVTNKTTESDITKVANAAAKNGSKVEYVKGTFQKTDATYTAKGKLSIMYRVTRNDRWREMYKRWEIPILTKSTQSTGTKQPSQTTGTKQPTPRAGTLLKNGKNTYKVLNKGSTVAFTGTKSTAKSISVPATITYNGVRYNVTEVSKNAFKNNKKLVTVKLGSNITKIGASAFYGCKRLKNITVSSRKLKSVGKKAFSGIHSKARVKVPSSKKKAYKKLLKGKGLGKKGKIV